MIKANYKKNKIVILMFTVIGLFLLSILSSGLTSVTNNAKLDKIQAEMLTLDKENKELSNVLIKNYSLTKISETAQKEGFLKPQNIVYLTNIVPVAER